MSDFYVILSYSYEGVKFNYICNLLLLFKRETNTV